MEAARRPCGMVHKPAVSMHATEGHAVIDQLAEGLSGPTTGDEKAGAKKMGAIPRQKMPEQEPANRVRNFEEYRMDIRLKWHGRRHYDACSVRNLSVAMAVLSVSTFPDLSN